MSYQIRNLRKAALVSAATFAIGLLLGFGVSVANAEEEKPMAVRMIEGCYQRGGFVLARTDAKTGKKTYVTFQCRPAFESEVPPTGQPPVEKKPPNSFPTAPNQMI